MVFSTNLATNARDEHGLTACGRERDLSARDSRTDLLERSGTGDLGRQVTNAVAGASPNWIWTVLIRNVRHVMEEIVGTAARDRIRFARKASLSSKTTY